MNRSILLATVSAAAFVSGVANAQTTATANGDTTDATTGDRGVVSCPTSNSCSVTQGAPGTTFQSTGSVTVVGGTTNTSSVNQTGTNQYAANAASGDRNQASQLQGGFFNSGTITQTGSSSGGTGTFTANYANIQQGQQTGNIGNSNSATITQVRTAGAAQSQFSNQSSIYQASNVDQNQNGPTAAGGSKNTAISQQDGISLISTIDQSDGAYTGAQGVAATNNYAKVIQVGHAGVASTGTFSQINQQQSGNTANVYLYDGGLRYAGQNYSYVNQLNQSFTSGANNTGFANGAPTTASNPMTGNLATVAATGQGNGSNVYQNGVQNTADVTMMNGGPGNTNQANGGTNPGTGASLLPNQGGQPNNRPQGNSSTIYQYGRGAYAAISSGGQVTANGGQGNYSYVYQYQPDVAVAQATLISAQTPSTAPRALVYQRGVLDASYIYQQNNSFGGNSTGSSGTTQSGSTADVSQLSFNSTTTISQYGTNDAVVTQGSRTETTGASDRLYIYQYDYGDLQTTTGAMAGNGFGSDGSSGTTSGTSKNSVLAVQYGIQNSASVNQSAINASATVFQAVGTRANTINIQQGTNGATNGESTTQRSAQGIGTNNGSGAQNLTATAYQTGGQSGTGSTAANNGAGATQALGITIVQSGKNLSAVANQSGGNATRAGMAYDAAGSSNNSILLAQANNYNSATVNQTGTGQIATVEQAGTGTATLVNKVTVTQSGGTASANGGQAAAANSAYARQLASVGVSASTDATAGIVGDANYPNSRSGANAAEIVILQSGYGNSGTVEQRGSGQYASLSQTGNNNVGGILQETGATNAVALLTQNGNGNTYYIDQTTAGQYVNVTQTGNNNVMITSTSGPTGTGNNNAATPTTRPAFTAGQQQPMVTINPL